MQHEPLERLAPEGIEALSLVIGAERGSHDRLCFAALKERRAVSAREHSHFDRDWTNRGVVPPVDALLVFDRHLADHLVEEILEGTA